MFGTIGILLQCKEQLVRTNIHKHILLSQSPKFAGIQREVTKNKYSIIKKIREYL